MLHRFFGGLDEHLDQSLLVLRLDGEDVNERGNLIVFRDCGHHPPF